MNTEEMNEIEKQAEEIGKSKNNSSKMFKSIKDLNKVKKRENYLLKMIINIQKNPPKNQLVKRSKCTTPKQQKF